ncbi:patatin-like phospholipase family protein [Paraburkholderia sp. RL18-103-BIB-C]|uniref:patatin-like phospholipase family protein n=1 Tax=Paraburkholderia sp. RL18-103-BIB-C TaxID=3031637 RepID=UPI0038B7190C
MKKPQPIQIAFQGGGAKITALMAAGQIIQALENDGVIKVTKVAGTSAGSIVASFIAAGIDIQSVRQRLLDGDGTRLLKAFPKPAVTWGLIKLLILGRPLWDTTVLHNWLSKLFAEKKQVTVADVRRARGIDLAIVKTDLGNRAAVYAAETDMVVNALIDSCGLPFAFRLWNKNDQAVIVDGGICENLPSGQLNQDPDSGFGPIVVVTFPQTPSKNPTGPLDFAGALLDAAMSSSMALTRAQAPAKSLLTLHTRTSTFDFNRALDVGLKDEYDRIVGECKEWFLTYLSGRKKDIEISEQDPWSETNPTALGIMQLIGDAYKLALGKQTLEYEYVRFQVYANSLRSDGDGIMNDRAEFELRFKTLVDQDPVTCMSFSLLLPGTYSLFRKASFCDVTGPTGPHRFVAIPIRLGQGDRELCLFFDPPLPPGTGSYTIRFYEDGDQLMKPLIEKGHDEVMYEPRRQHNGMVAKIDVVLSVPDGFPVQLIPVPAGPQASGVRELTPAECAQLPNHFGGMVHYGYHAESVSGIWGVKVFKS